ncbi:MAG: hypothetical protein NT123_09660 [Proteobacteria bacterium]|nr:hypothetical protein [Pseudomonadota bacterium]
MPITLRRLSILSLLLSLAPGLALAARPFNTDDARIVDAGGCQIETFVKKQSKFGERETWFLPGCNPGGNLELTFGGLNIRNDAEGRASALIAQGKTLLRPLQTNDYGVALTMGTTRQRAFDAAVPSHWSPFFNLISSVSLYNDVVVIHANGGALDDRNTGVVRPTWGLGSEILVAPRLYAIVESYGQKGEKAGQQVGFRFWVVPNHVQIDGTLGSQRSGPPARNWMSLGLRLLF